ncbi:MAG: response regulator [Holophagaceae bacterium]|nr:response regulator [Holophagaceae bacterium]
MPVPSCSPNDSYPDRPVGPGPTEGSPQESPALLNLLLANAPAAIAMFDNDMRYLAASNRWLEHHRVSGQPVLGRSHYEVSPDLPQRWKEVHQRCLAGAAESSEGDPYLHADGSTDWLRWEVRPWNRGDGTIGGIVMYTEFITDRRQTEQEQAQLQNQLGEAQKWQSLGTLASGIAHEMNNVLGAILGLASVHLELDPKGSSSYRSFEIMAKAAARGSKTVRRLLAYTRKSPSEEREFDVNAILQEDAELWVSVALAKVWLVLDLEPELRPMRGEASALGHTFQNLCLNAVEAMPLGGVLTFRTRNLDRQWIEITVEDTGTGMEPSVLERAMDPFFSTKEEGKGAGLGLAMVYSTVKAHRGELSLQSEVGRGTRVTLRFPATEAPAESLRRGAPARPEARVRAMNILLVDDDPLVQSSLETLIHRLGHEVKTASSGEEALAEVTLGYQPEVVILDLNMPGLGGAETLPRLRKLLPEVPILISTGRTDQQALDLSRTCPHTALLPKPYGLRELQKSLEPFQAG